MNRHALLAALLIALLALASTWLSRRSHQETAPADLTRADTPDYFIVGLTVIETGQDGRPVQRLEAQQLDHFPGGRTELQLPHLIVRGEDGPDWHAYAARGVSHDPEEQFDLQGDVRLMREAPASLSVETETLQVYPRQRRAETADAVTITAPQGVIHAVGLEAALDTRRLTLHSQVRGTYAP